MLQLSNACLNSSLENSAHSNVGLFPNSLRMSVSTWHRSIVLKVVWRAPHKLSGVRYGWLLNLIASTAESLHLLTQYINSHGLQLLFMTSWIFKSKNDLLEFFMTFLNLFQFSRLLVVLYSLRDLLQSSFYHCLECFEILDCLACLFQAWLMSTLRWLTMFSRWGLSEILDVSRFLKIEVTSSTKTTFYLLFCWIKSLKVLTASSMIGMEMVKGAWSDVRRHSRWIKWWLVSSDLYQRNMRSMIELDTSSVSEYLVGQGLVRDNRVKLKELAIIKRSLLIEK